MRQTRDLAVFQRQEYNLKVQAEVTEVVERKIYAWDKKKEEEMISYLREFFFSFFSCFTWRSRTCSVTITVITTERESCSVPQGFHRLIAFIVAGSIGTMYMCAVFAPLSILGNKSNLILLHGNRGFIHCDIKPGLSWSTHGIGSMWSVMSLSPSSEHKNKWEKLEEK